MNSSIVKSVVEFLDEHADLLENNNFDSLLSEDGGSIYLGAFLYEELGIEFWNYMTCVPSHMLYGSEKLEHIKLSDDITKIGVSAFRKCTSLQSINIPNSVTEIDMSAFSHCKSLKSIIIPSSVTKIYGWAFRSCTSLESITILNSATWIGGQAFENCPKLTIKAPKDSFAIEYAKKNNIKYVEI